MQPTIKLYIEDENGIDVYGKYDKPVEYYSLQALHDDIYEMEVACQRYEEAKKQRIEDGVEAKTEAKDFTESEKKEIGDWNVGRLQDIRGKNVRNYSNSSNSDIYAYTGVRCDANKIRRIMNEISSSWDSN